MTLDEVRWILIGARKARGWTQPALGHRLRISEHSMLSWELGNASPRIVDVENWVDALGYEIRYELVKKGRL